MGIEKETVNRFIPEELDRYTYWIEERERIRHLKEELKQDPPWTEDPILKEFKFCQVFREDDRTTRWFRTHMREPLRNSPDVFMATIAFRFFNLIETGRTLLDNNLHIQWDRPKAIEEIKKNPKWITGAYIVKSPNRMDKVTGVTECVSHLWDDRENIIKQLESFTTLEEAWKFLMQYPYIGPFVSYEMVTDLRHTYLLENATDICSWGNPGPGAMRGLNRLTGRPLEFCKRSWDWHSEMLDLYDWCSQKLDLSKLNYPFEMREVEGGLCEFDKYSRILKGQGRTRSVYNYSERNRPLIEDIKNGESRWEN
jgi:hypothetical protein|tara:strand:- start:4552 stop:5484 length:933 start_codon:yes stop_codon:yes gene_type:complete